MATEQIFNNYFVFGKTDCGKSRDHNEDNILINSKSALIMIADGMGGHQFGDKASLEAVTLIDTLIERHLPAPLNQKQHFPLVGKIIDLFLDSSQYNFKLKEYTHIIEDILIETNKVLYQQNQTEQFADGRGMGTTVVGCRMMEHPAKMTVFHVGDSRMYRLRNNRLSQITKDHSAYQFWLDNGQIGKQPNSNVILQGIGPSPAIKPEVQTVNIGKEDSFLLCSDGLSDMVEEQDIEEIMRGLSQTNIEEKVQQLIDAANNNGGADNISVVLICQ